MGAAYFLCRDGASSGVSGSRSGVLRGPGSGSSLVRVLARESLVVVSVLAAVGLVLGPVLVLVLGPAVLFGPVPGRGVVR